ncbi:DUF3857 and transglutaminase domain-containing protein [Flavobacterium salilacus subsp. salilacus]|uniref:DUF3857 domain-containing protein n=1 Tax=Flavobacterium TaxID=237 RepID=UPI001074AC42|nr:MULTISPECIES: DUF3857 domain-containing protein [Flavobacterium]KAF2519910.1 DUF3857 and transglutaminase domain-containing protein [Flavobacterium salilacus subsp. salilacus]MBE1614182.1 DUF3857 domain-containing protein [Flavobacterium sp. SaA2.13]
MKNITLLIAFTFLSFGAFAQKFELGNVSIDELKEKAHKEDPSAPAAVLYEKGVTYFDFDSSGDWIIVTDVEVRTKIYTKEGYSHANVEIPYYTKGLDKEEVIFTDVVTYNLNGDKIEKTKLKNEGEFKENYSVNWHVKKITLPAVKEGSIIEYHYQKKSPFIRNIPAWYFQGELPVNNTEYTIKIPQYFTYNRILSPYFPIKEEQDTKKTTRIYSNPNPKGGYGQSSSVLKNEVGSVVFYEIIKKYQAENVPALKGEHYVDNIKNYLSFVKHELAKTNFPNQEEKKYASDWDAVVKSIYNDENFGRELDEKSYFEDDIRALVAGTNMTRDELVAIIYNYVRDRMTFNKEFKYECTNGVKKAYAEKTGNVAEINLMLIAMLRYAGLNVNPILISTRANGHVSFVNRTEFNYVVAGLESQNGIVFLDATSKNGVPGLLPIRALNVTGRIIRENLSSAEVFLTPDINSVENNIVMANLKSDGSMDGQIRTQYFDYNAYMFREAYLDTNQDSYISKREKELGNIIISDYKLTNDKEYDKPVTEGFSFQNTAAADVIGDKIYISPMLFYAINGNPFKQENRTYPVDFIYPHQDRYNISITIPEGYMIETMPESATVAMEGNICTFRFNIAQRGNQIQMSISNDVNVGRLNPEYYNDLKTYFNDMLKKQNEKIVLKKL